MRRGGPSVRRRRLASFAAATLLLIATSGLGSIRPAAATADSRVVIDQADGWLFALNPPEGAQAPGFDDHTWLPVSVPYTWNALDGQDGAPGTTQGATDYKQGVGWFRKHVTVPADLAGKRLFLEIDAANLTTNVYAGGVLVGHHDGGYTRFRVDLTGIALPGADTVIALAVDNRVTPNFVAPITADYTFFGGVYRGIRLVATDPVHVTMSDSGGPGIRFVPHDVSAASAMIDVSATLVNDDTQDHDVHVVASLQDGGGAETTSSAVDLTVAAGGSQLVTVPLTVVSPHLWDGTADPYLYKGMIDVVNGGDTVDHVEVTVGLRDVQIDPSTGLSLNGHHVSVRGVNMHQDRPGRGFMTTAADVDQDLSIATEMGANAVRLAHYPHAEWMYERADELGLLVWTEIPFINRTGGSSTFRDTTLSQLTEMIRQLEAHPSIITWGIANEVDRTTNPVDPVPLLSLLNARAHENDPSRPTTLATCCELQPDAPSTEITDLIGYNRYFGWYYGKTKDLGPFLDGVHAAEPGKRMTLSEYAAGGSTGIHADPGKRLDHSEEYQALYHEQTWPIIAARPYLWGAFVWSLFDFASDGRKESDLSGRNDKGLVTYDRTTRKDAFYFYKATWTTTPVTHIVGDRFTQRTSATTTVKIYANTDKVELILNGVSQGVQKVRAKRVFTWPVTLQPGVNTVSAIGRRANVVVATDDSTWNVGPAPTELNIDVGSTSSYVDGSGTTWSPDNGSTDGTTGTITETINGSSEPSLDSTFRTGDLRYSLPLVNGTYNVTVRMVEPTATAKALRVFKVTADGYVKVNAIDLYLLGGTRTLVTRTFAVNVTGGVLNLGFQSTIDRAVVSAISVMPA